MAFVKTRIEIEGHVTENIVEVPDNEVTPWSQDQKFKIVGQNIRRIDGVQRVTGRAVYAADLQLPGMVWLKILRSPYPHAEIVDIDTSEAEKIPGVLAILHHKNTEAMKFEADNIVFNPVARYVGAEVAAVAAVNEHIARDAINSIKVTYKVLPFMVDPVKALEPDAPKLWPNGNLVGGKPVVISRGNVAQGFAEADAVVEVSLSHEAAHHCCMEAHGLVARWENGDHLIVYDSTQSVYRVQQGLAATFNMPASQVRVHRDYMGGGFGSKTGVEKYHIITVMMAKKLGLPVKLTLERWEEIITTGHRPKTVMKLKAGCTKDGTLTALEFTGWISVGAYSRTARPGIAVRELYLCPNMRTTEYNVYTNHMPTGAMRGPGNTEGMGIMEAAMDKLAEAIGMDGIAFRNKNDTPWGDQVAKIPYSTKGLAKSYELGSKEIGWATKRNQQPGAGDGPIKRGVGMGSLIWGAPGGPPSAANVMVLQDGSVIVSSAFNDLGEGAITAMAMVTAEELGVPLEMVSVRHGDTSLGAFDLASFGSRLTPSLTPAIRNAAAEARRLVLKAASELLDLPVEDLSLEDGMITSKSDPKKNQPLRNLARRFTHAVVGFGFRGPNPERHRVNAFGSHFVEVEVDTRTGAVKILNFAAAHDCGRAINPFLVEGQIFGGVTLGRGYATSEERVIDRNTGVPLTMNYVEYKLPTSIDSPPIKPFVIEEVDPYSNNTGVKGMAEPPCIPTAGAVLNAIYNATGVMLTEFPATPDRVLRALKAAKK